MKKKAERSEKLLQTTVDAALMSAVQKLSRAEGISQSAFVRRALIREVNRLQIEARVRGAS